MSLKKDYYEKEFYEASASHIRDFFKEKNVEIPKLAIILGSGLAGLCEGLENMVDLPYTEVPNMLPLTNKMHEGRFVYGLMDGVPVLMLSGRPHYYEGYNFTELAQPVRILSLLGIEKLVLTNAAGSVNKNYQIGEIMIINDHIKLAVPSPLRGPNIEEFGTRFPDMSDVYSARLRSIAWKAVVACGAKGFCEGVYCFMPGPQYETKAEIRALEILGADAVGMSTVPEAITAVHCGIEVLGLSMISNMGTGISNIKLDDREVAEVGKRTTERFIRFIREMVKLIDADEKAAAENAE